jgi:hypothetical protein
VLVFESAAIVLDSLGPAEGCEITPGAVVAAGSDALDASGLELALGSVVGVDCVVGEALTVAAAVLASVVAAPAVVVVGCAAVVAGVGSSCPLLARGALLDSVGSAALEESVAAGSSSAWHWQSDWLATTSPNNTVQEEEGRAFIPSSYGGLPASASGSARSRSLLLGLVSAVHSMCLTV